MLYFFMVEYIIYLEFFCKGDLPLSLHLLIYSIIYQCGHMDICFILWVIIQYYLYCCLNCCSFDDWELFL